MQIKCLACNTVITSTGKSQVCNCDNRLMVSNNTFTAVDLSKVVVLNNVTNVRETGHLTQDQLQWQEQRRKRRIHKLTYEER